MPRQVAYTMVGAVIALSIVAPGYASRYGAILLAILAVSALARGARLRRADYWAIALAAWSLASLFWALDPELALTSWKDLGGGVAIFVSIRLLVDSAQGMRVVVIAYLAGCLWAAFRLSQSDLGSASVTLTDSTTRATLDGVNANHLAYALTVGVVLVPLLWAVKRPALLGRLTTFALVAATYVLGITQTGTRAALVALVVLALWMALWRVGAVRSLRAAIAAFVVVQAVIWSGLLDERARLAIVASARETGTLNGRLEFWPAARAVFNQNVFAGVGLDGFMALNGGTAAHNVALDLGAGLGVVGIFLFAVWLYQTLIVETREVDARVRTLLVGGTVVALTPILASGFWHESPTFWAATALVSLLSTVKPRTEPSATTEPPTARAGRPHQRHAVR